MDSAYLTNECQKELIWVLKKGVSDKKYESKCVYFRIDGAFQSELVYALKRNLHPPCTSLYGLHKHS